MTPDHVKSCAEPWEVEFDKCVAELDNPYFLDNTDGDVAEFGYKKTQGDWIFTITDWSNVKDFIRRLLSQQCQHFITPEGQRKCIQCNPRVK